MLLLILAFLSYISVSKAVAESESVDVDLSKLESGALVRQKAGREVLAEEEDEEGEEEEEEEEVEEVAKENAKRDLQGGDMSQLFSCPAFRATNTNNARVNFVSCGITACGGSTFTADSCASYTGNTFASLVTTAGLLLSSNEDSPLCGPGEGSAVITYTVPGSSDNCPVFVLRQGCFQNTTCSGQMVISGTSGVASLPVRLNSPTMNPAASLSPTPGTPIFSCPSFSASNTSSDSQNMINCGIRACGGQSFTASLCPTFGGLYTGNTFLALLDGGGNVLRENDDFCIIGSQITYTVPGPPSSCSLFTLRQGCAGDSSCTGTTVVVGTLGVRYETVPTPTPPCPINATFSLLFGRCLCQRGSALVNGACTLCPPGQFGSVPGLTACERCGPNGFSTIRGATSCQACPSGARALNGRPPCACAPGFSSSGSGSSLVCTRIPGMTPAPSPARIRQLFSCPQFSTNNTNTAQTNWIGCGIRACGGSTFEIDTCLGYVGNTYIRLMNSLGMVVQNSVDSPACGLGLGSAFISYTVPGPPSACQTFVARQGCFGNAACSGTSAVSGNVGVSASPVPVIAPTSLPPGLTPAPSSQTPVFTCPPFMANNTNSATVNFAPCGVRACGGQSFTASSCVNFGGNYFGDTFVSLVNSAGAIVATNNDFCFVGSQLTYTVPGPSSQCSVFTLRLGCAGNQSCGGTFVVLGNPNVQYREISAATPPCPNNSLWNRLFGRCLCQPGFVMSLSLNQCVVCPPGYFAGINGTKVCATCPPNQFNNVQGASRCTPCPANSEANFDGATQCVCSPGFVNTARRNSPTINCASGSQSAPPSAEPVAVPTQMPNRGLTQPPRSSAPTPTNDFVLYSPPTVSTPFNYVEVTTFGGLDCSASSRNSMVSGTNTQICGTIAGGNQQRTTCANNQISITTFPRNSACSSSSSSGNANPSYTFRGGCLQTGPSTSTRQQCITTTTPFSQYGAGLLYTWSNDAPTCQRSPIFSNKWTLTPINRCISNIPGQAPYVITRCNSANNTYTVAQFASSDIFCTGAPTSRPNTVSIQQCVREPSGLFVGVRCVNN